jgi:hypothetical protein
MDICSSGLLVLNSCRQERCSNTCSGSRWQGQRQHMASMQTQHMVIVQTQHSARLMNVMHSMSVTVVHGTTT